MSIYSSAHTVHIAHHYIGISSHQALTCDTIKQGTNRLGQDNNELNSYLCHRHMLNKRKLDWSVRTVCVCAWVVITATANVVYRSEMCKIWCVFHMIGNEYSVCPINTIETNSRTLCSHFWWRRYLVRYILTVIAHLFTFYLDEICHLMCVSENKNENNKKPQMSGSRESRAPRVKVYGVRTEKIAHFRNFLPSCEIFDWKKTIDFICLLFSITRLTHIHTLDSINENTRCNCHKFNKFMNSVAISIPPHAHTHTYAPNRIHAHCLSIDKTKCASLTRTSRCCKDSRTVAAVRSLCPRYHAGRLFTQAKMSLLLNWIACHRPVPRFCFL